MRLLTFVILVFVLMPMVAFSRDTLAVSIKGIEFHLNPVFLASKLPRYQIGIEWRNGNQAISLDLGIGFYEINKNKYTVNNITSNYSFYEISPKFKIFLSPKKSSYYIAFNPTFMSNRQKLYNSVYRKNSTGFVYSQVDFIGQRFGMNFISGAKVYMKKRFTIDVYIGLGAQYQVVNFSNAHLVEKLAHSNSNSDISWKHSTQSEENNYVLSGTIGLAIGFLFKE